MSPGPDLGALHALGRMSQVGLQLLPFLEQDLEIKHIAP